MSEELSTHDKGEMLQKYEPIFWDIETTGLNPMAKDYWDGEVGAQVTCVVLGTIDGWRRAGKYCDAEYNTKVLWDRDESRLLKVVRERLSEIIGKAVSSDYNINPFLVGWNSKGFDHPYIAARYAAKGIGNSKVNHLLKRLDMMQALGDDDVMGKLYPGQDEYAKSLDIPVDDSVTGADMVSAFKVGDWDTIAEHGRTDVVEMMKVFVERKKDLMDYFYRQNGESPQNAPVYSRKIDY